jgi:hypothetical protein
LLFPDYSISMVSHIHQTLHLRWWTCKCRWTPSTYDENHKTNVPATCLTKCLFQLTFFSSIKLGGAEIKDSREGPPRCIHFIWWHKGCQVPPLICPFWSTCMSYISYRSRPGSILMVFLKLIPNWIWRFYCGEIEWDYDLPFAPWHSTWEIDL